MYRYNILCSISGRAYCYVGILEVYLRVDILIKLKEKRQASKREIHQRGCICFMCTFIKWTWVHHHHHYYHHRRKIWLNFKLKCRLSVCAAYVCWRKLWTTSYWRDVHSCVIENTVLCRNDVLLNIYLISVNTIEVVIRYFFSLFFLSDSIIERIEGESSPSYCGLLMIFLATFLIILGFGIYTLFISCSESKVL